MTHTALASIVAALQTGLATVTGLSSTTVTDNDWRTANAARSVFVFPSGNGRQTLEHVSGWGRVHNVTVEVYLKNTGSLAALYDDTQTYIDTVLDWLETNDTLTTGVYSAHWGDGVRYDVADILSDKEPHNIIYRIVSFVIPVRV